jgi:sulfur-oxidizing protein SoxY
MKASQALPRRILLTMVGAGVIAPLASQGARAASGPSAEMTKILAGRTPKVGGLRLDVPAIAENGLVVPLNVDADSPMTDADFIRAIHVFAEGNPNPLVATFHFTPACGRAAASIRIRLAQTQNVVAIAETSGGELRIAQGEVKVTIGGCGG